MLPSSEQSLCLEQLNLILACTVFIARRYDRVVYAVVVSVVSRSQRVSLIVIPFCLSVCRSFRDLQPTTIDRSQPKLVGRYIPIIGPV